MRKVVVVGDNRTANNWGGRGASIMLLELLSRRFAVEGTVPGSSFYLGAAGFGYVDTLVGPRYYWIFEHSLLQRKRRRVFDWYVRLEELFGARDFVADDPGRTADNIIAHKDRNERIGALYSLVTNAHAIVINGEGDFVLTSPPRRAMLLMLGLAELGVRSGKPVVFVNMLLQEESVGDAEALAPLRGAARVVFAKCRGVLVRERSSLEYLRHHMPEVKVDLVPDSLFAMLRSYERWGYNLPANGDFLLPYPEERDFWGRIDLSKDYICIGGGATAATQSEKALECYVDLVRAIQTLGLNVCLTENDGTDSFLRQVAARTGVGLVPVGTPLLLAGAVLANARLFISGRYHPAILATLGGTPCIFLESMANKTRGLQLLLEYEADTPIFAAWPARVDCEQIKQLAISYLDEGERLRSRLKDVARRRCNEAERLAPLVDGLLS